jgi:hypothetical protein
LIDQYGTADVLVAEVQLRHFYPGGPIAATFIARSGPDGRPLGSVTMRASNSAALPELMEQGVQRLDGLFTQALAAGMLTPDPSLIIPEPPAPPEEEEVTETKTEAKVAAQVVQIVVTGPLSPASMLRSFGGVESVTEIGQAIVVVTYRGSASALQSALARRGWTVTSDVGGLRVSGAPTPSAPAPVPTPPQPVAPAPAAPPPPRPATP